MYFVRLRKYPAILNDYLRNNLYIYGSLLVSPDVSTGLYWCLMISMVVYQCIRATSGFYWCLLVSFWSILVSVCSFFLYWPLLGSPGLHRCTLVDNDVHWSLLRILLIYWSLLVYWCITIIVLMYIQLFTGVYWSILKCILVSTNVSTGLDGFSSRP